MTDRFVALKLENIIGDLWISTNHNLVILVKGFGHMITTIIC